MARSETWFAGWRPYALLAALCLCLYVPGIAAIPVLDRDEARFAQTSRQMLETGDFLHIRFHDETRNRKPAGIYWLQAAAVRVFSSAEASEIWPYRLPSLLGATLAVLLTFGLGRAVLRETGDPGAATRGAMLGAVLLATALEPMAEAHIAKTDAALLAAIVAGQGALGLAYVRARAGGAIGPGIAAGFWLAQIAAIYLKGPVAPALALTTAIALSIADRDLGWLRGLRPLAGIAATALAILPWLIAIEHATEGQFLADSLGRDFLSKLIGGREAHGAPPFYYLALAILTFWPGSRYLAPALIHGWQRHEQPVERFLLAWIVPAWVFIELVPTKLPHYVLPLYPALALLAAGAIGGQAGERPAWARSVSAVNTGLWVLATLILAGALIYLPIRFGDGIPIAGVVGAALLIVLAVALLYRRPGPSGTAGILIALALALIVPAAGWVVPSLDRLWLSRDAAAMIDRHPPAAGAPLVVVGYNEPSLVFLLDAKLLVNSPAAAAAALAGGGEALVVGRETAVFEQGLTARGLTARPIESVRGTDYSNGQRMVLTLYEIGPN
jgi:4-amino-4-deoxy-L-arabinose transferase-like glycosyltransferase